MGASLSNRRSRGGQGRRHQKGLSDQSKQCPLMLAFKKSKNFRGAYIA